MSGGGISFRTFCDREGVTKPEQEALAWHLAMMRARRLYATLCGGWNGPKL